MFSTNSYTIIQNGMIYYNQIGYRYYPACGTFSVYMHRHVLDHMKITAYIKKLEPRNPFRIARGEKRVVENVFVCLEDNGMYGYGEASPNSYYGERADTVLEKLSSVQYFLSDKQISSVQQISELWRQAWPILKPSRAAQCALDIALFDILGKKLKTNVCRLLWGHDPHKVITSYTIGICSPQEWQERVTGLGECPVIKIKVDNTGDLEFLRYVRSQTDAAIRVDANCSWGSLDIADMLRKLNDLRVEFLEQPLPPEENSRMIDILKGSPLPILADESSVTTDDVESCVGQFSGINIKLVKCGGLTPGLEMYRKAKNKRLRVMVGCMLESNLLIAAGAALAQQTEYADLDGSWLLTDRVFDGIEIERGEIVLCGADGLGVLPGTAF